MAHYCPDCEFDGKCRPTCVAKVVRAAEREKAREILEEAVSLCEHGKIAKRYCTLCWQALKFKHLPPQQGKKEQRE